MSTLNETPVSHPVQSPDGRQIAFAFSNYLILTVHVDGSAYTCGNIVPDSNNTQRQISVNPTVPIGKAWAINDPVWSPDGQSIAYIAQYTDTSNVLHHEVDVVSGVADSAGTCTVPNAPQTVYQFLFPQGHAQVGVDLFSLAWSPDSSQLAATGEAYDSTGSISDFGLYQISATGSVAQTAQPLFTLPNSSDPAVLRLFTSPAWSSNGYIAFVADMQDYYSEIFAIPATGGAPQQITAINANNLSQNPVYNINQIGSISWSPDSSQIAFDMQMNEDTQFGFFAGVWQIDSVPFSGGSGPGTVSLIFQSNNIDYDQPNYAPYPLPSGPGPTPTQTFTASFTPSITQTPSYTPTLTPSDTPTNTDTLINICHNTPVAPSKTPRPGTIQPTATPCDTKTPTATHLPTNTPRPTYTPTPTLCVVVVTPVPTANGGSNGAESIGGVCLLVTPLPPGAACSVLLNKPHYGYYNLSDILFAAPYPATPFISSQSWELLDDSQTGETHAAYARYNGTNIVQIDDGTGIGTSPGKKVWVDSGYGVDQVLGDCHLLPPPSTPSPTPTLAPGSPTLTPLTPTLLPPPLPTDPYAEQAYLRQYFGIFLTVAPGLPASEQNYWTTTDYHTWDMYQTRTDAVYHAALQYDQNILAALSGINNLAPGQYFQQVYGAYTEFQYTGQTSQQAGQGNLGAAFTQYGDKTHGNLVYIYKLIGHPVMPYNYLKGPPSQNARDAVYQPCGSNYDPSLYPTPPSQTIPVYGLLDLTECTVTHELGHVLVSRAGGGQANPNPSYTQIGPLLDSTGQIVFGPLQPPCSSGVSWDPGQRGWPWRDHPIVPYFNPPSYLPTLCATNPATIEREFEADMVMNVVTGFFGSSTDPAAQRRLEWMTVASGTNRDPYFINLVNAAQSYTGS